MWCSKCHRDHTPVCPSFLPPQSVWCSRCHRSHGPAACPPTAPPLFTTTGTLNPRNPQAAPMLDPISGGLRPQFQTTLFGQIHMLNGGPLAR
ncbi:MAG: hypothetical protein HYZ81_15560 [Nitrospinae bacterium]|nr:hypothetical protein [Nitrospinota bacterium]